MTDKTMSLAYEGMHLLYLVDSFSGNLFDSDPLSTFSFVVVCEI